MQNTLKIPFVLTKSQQSHLNSVYGDFEFKPLRGSILCEHAVAAISLHLEVISGLPDAVTAENTIFVTNGINIIDENLFRAPTASVPTLNSSYCFTADYKSLNDVPDDDKKMTSHLVFVCTSGAYPPATFASLLRDWPTPLTIYAVEPNVQYRTGRLCANELKYRAFSDGHLTLGLSSRTADSLQFFHRSIAPSSQVDNQFINRGVIRSGVDYTCYAYSLSDVPMQEVDPDPNFSVIMGGSYYGMVDFRTSNQSANNTSVHVSAPAVFRTTVNTGFFFGTFAVLSNSKVEFTLPLSVYRSALNYMAGKPRTTETYTNLLSFVKREVSTLILLPTDDITAIISLVTALVFSDVEQELVTFQSIVLGTGSYIDRLWARITKFFSFSSKVDEYNKWNAMLNIESHSTAWPKWIFFGLSVVAGYWMWRRSRRPAQMAALSVNFSFEADLSVPRSIRKAFRRIADAAVALYSSGYSEAAHLLRVIKKSFKSCFRRTPVIEQKAVPVQFITANVTEYVLSLFRRLTVTILRGIARGATWFIRTIVYPPASWLLSNSFLIFSLRALKSTRAFLFPVYSLIANASGEEATYVRLPAWYISGLVSNTVLEELFIIFGTKFMGRYFQPFFGLFELCVKIVSRSSVPTIAIFPFFMHVFSGLIRSGSSWPTTFISGLIHVLWNLMASNADELVTDCFNRSVEVIPFVRAYFEHFGIVPENDDLYNALFANLPHYLLVGMAVAYCVWYLYHVNRSMKEKISVTTALMSANRYTDSSQIRSLSVTKTGIHPYEPYLQRPIVSSTKLVQIDNSARVQIPLDAVETKTKPNLAPVSIAFPDHVPTHYSGTLSNQLRAVVNRQLMAKLDPDEEVISAYIDWLHLTSPWRSRDIRGTLVEMASLPVRPYKFTAWLAHFPGATKRKLLEAKQRVDEGFPIHKTMSAFVKIEKASNCNELGLADKDPRNISSPAPDFNVVTGPWFYAVSKYMVQNWHVHNHITYASTMHAEDLGHWLEVSLRMSTRVFWMRSDFKRFDGTQGKKMMNARYSIYKALGWPSYVRTALTKNQRYRAVTKDGIRASVDGTQPSGRADTSCGNSLTSATVLAHILESRGWEYKEYRILVLGDDLLLASSKPLEGVDFALAFSLYGLRAEPNLVYDLSDLEFCSGLFWPVRQLPQLHCGCEVRYVWGPKPGRVLPKAGWLIDPDKVGKDKLLYLRSWYLGVWKSYNHVPFLSEYAASIGELTKHVGNVAPLINYNLPLVRQAHTRSDDWYDFVSRRYQIEEVQVHEICDAIIAVRHLPAWLTSTLLEVLYSRDC